MTLFTRTSAAVEEVALALARTTLELEALQTSAQTLASHEPAVVKLEAAARQPDSVYNDTMRAKLLALASRFASVKESLATELERATADRAARDKLAAEEA
jgi:glycine cleavage system regulatory protein